VRWATANGALLHFPHGVGDFVESGQALVEVFGSLGDHADAAAHLTGKIALGIERTIEQDPAFAVRSTGCRRRARPARRDSHTALG
jgi:uncharacterized membrane protein